MPHAKAKEVWDTALGELELQVSRPTFETWLRDTAGRALDGATLMVTVPSPFTAEWLEKRMSQLIRKTLQRVTGQSLEVRFQVHSPLPEEESSLSEPSWTLPLEEAPWGAPSRNGPLNERYSFETFVVGPSNRLAYSAAQAVADFPGLSYNPLFIYSGVGLGKTHLLHAIGHAVAKKGLSSLYVTTEQFTNEFVTAIRARTTEDFRAKYRNVEVLLIDDIQFIGGKEQTQEGFFHTFNDLHTARRQLVITSDRPPRAL
ncbi:MAG: DnaA ATPase domain-containing protein, partial [Dehalococcoidia bacterium]